MAQINYSKNSIDLFQTERPNHPANQPTPLRSQEYNNDKNSENSLSPNQNQSFNTTGQSSRTSRRSEIKSLKGERFVAKLCRSASNSPRIDYHSNSFLESIKNKANQETNSKTTEKNDLNQTLHVRNSSKEIEDLENQWKVMKSQHQFNSREPSTSPYRNQVSQNHSNSLKINTPK